MRILYIIFFTSASLIAQQEIENIPDTTFVNSITFEITYDRLTDQQIKEKRNQIQLNYQTQDQSSIIQMPYNSILEETIKKYYQYRWLPKIYALLGYYEPLFELSLQYYKLPLELKYVAVIESNLNPQATSNVGASGLWQFMPETGKEYGLAKNNYINLFYDPYLSTDAASRYFNYLYSIFQDWNLVLSAYNCGQGRVLSAIKKAGTNDYFKVRTYLPKETRDYVMKFHAVKFLHNMYDLYYDKTYKLPINFENLQEHHIKTKTTFKEYCRVKGISLELTYFLNPHLITEQIPAKSFIYIYKK